MESKYKFFQIALAVLGFPIFIFIFFYLSNDSSLSFQNLIEKPSLFSVFLALAFLSFAVSMITVMVQIRKLTLSPSQIEAKYPFPIFDNTIRIRDLDYFMVVFTDNKKDSENIWLIKDKKVKMIISVRFYKNFEEMKNYLSAHLEKKTPIKVNYFHNYLAKFNFTITKLP